jgi:hypothetical protein
MNPNTKYLLQYENMIGKDVIGIMATAEKVFFNLCNYWNEGVRSNDDAYIENL